MTYAGIGARLTPKTVQADMVKIGRVMAEAGFTLMSGGAVGADKAFEKGCDEVKGKKDIIFKRDADPLTRLIAKEIHPSPSSLKPYAVDFLARNTFQVFGRSLETPVDVVIAWSPCGMISSDQRTSKAGGTGQGLDMASRKGIPIINLKVHSMSDFEAFFNHLPWPSE